VSKNRSGNYDVSGLIRNGKDMVSTELVATVIIPTYGRPDYLRDAVESVQKQSLRVTDYEIVIVDNGPNAEAKPMVDELNKRGRNEVRYIREPRIGLHNARHAGARRARGEVLVYIDDDVISPPQWLKALVHPFQDPQVACAGGKTVPKWEAEPPAWLNQFPDIYLSLLDLGNRVQELKWPAGVYGCNMAVRRSALYEVGGFHPDGFGDRRLIWYRGDGETGLHKKIYDAGYKVMYIPEAWLYHRIPSSRMKAESFYWRAFTQGISDSYSHAREYPSRYRMIKHSGRCLINAARSFWKSKSEIGEKVRERAEASYWYGRGQHQLRVALSPKLYSHVTKNSYLLDDTDTNFP
jgi:glycosyltransferase involved in cell wall biosynthesis